MKLIYLKLALKCDSLDVPIGIKIRFLRVSIAIEPGHSLVRYHELFDFGFCVTWFVPYLVAAIATTMRADVSLL